MNSLDLRSRFTTAAEEVRGKVDVQPAQIGSGSAAAAPAAVIAAPSVDTTASDQGKPAPSPNGSGEAASKRPYPAPADIPTQRGPKGLRFDFNDGCRVVLPESDDPWQIRLTDLDTGNILFQTELKAGRVNSIKRYFIRFRL